MAERAMQFHGKDRLRRLSPALIFLLSVLSGVSPRIAAADTNNLFPVDVDYGSMEWTDIAPSEAVRLIDEAVEKQPRYGSARGQILLYFDYGFALDRQFMVQLFGRISRTDDTETLRETTEPIGKQQPDTEHKFNWAEVTIVEDGEDVIEKSSAIEAVSYTYLSTGKIKIIYEGALGQADVALPGLQNRMYVNRFASFFIPLIPIKDVYIRSAMKTSELVKLARGTERGPSRTSIFSQLDGSIRYDVQHSEDGALVEESWLGVPKEWPGGVRYPTSLLSFKYKDGKVAFVKAVAIKQAQFNVHIDPSEFAVAIPAGTTVVDSREGEPAKAIRVNEDIGDLVSALDVGLNAMMGRTPSSLGRTDESSSTRRTVLIVLNVVVVAILLVLIVLVRRRASDSR